jgi:hypothetical protein
MNKSVHPLKRIGSLVGKVLSVVYRVGGPSGNGATMVGLTEPVGTVAHRCSTLSSERGLYVRSAETLTTSSVSQS